MLSWDEYDESSANPQVALAATAEAEPAVEVPTPPPVQPEVVPEPPVAEAASVATPTPQPAPVAPQVIPETPPVEPVVVVAKTIEDLSVDAEEYQRVTVDQKRMIKHEH